MISGGVVSTVRGGGEPIATFPALSSAITVKTDVSAWDIVTARRGISDSSVRVGSCLLKERGTLPDIQVSF